VGLRSFFHKIKIGFVRASQPSIPPMSDVKRYGNYGEDELIFMLRRALPDCSIKRNVIITTPEGNAELDCLVLCNNKLFAIEVKRWKGYLVEREDGFLQQKTDRWTGELHEKYMKSPFKQLSRAIYLLRKQIPINAWVNPIVFFDGNELEGISTKTEQVWFTRYDALANYIHSGGNASFGKNAYDFFNQCLPADYLYVKAQGKSMACYVNRPDLQFQTPQGTPSPYEIDSIEIRHHWSCDDLTIIMKNGVRHTVRRENAWIRVFENGSWQSFPLCKIDSVILSRTL